MAETAGPATRGPDDGGFLLIRAWTERGGSPPLRARVTSTVDVSRDEEHVRVLTDPEEVLTAVRAWLTAVAEAT